MERPDAQLTALLLALPLGKTLWMPARGVSMRPILRTHDSIFVVRCEEPELLRGDMAILQAPSGQLRAHLVLRTQPLVTTTFWGQPDEAGLKVVGKARAYKRGTHTFEMTDSRRRKLLLLSRWWTRMVQVRQRVAKSGFGKWLLGPRTQTLRKFWWGPVEMRHFTSQDLPLLASHTPLHVAPDVKDLESLVPPHGKTVVVWAKEAVQGIVSVNEAGQVKQLYVTPLARGLGWEERLLEEVDGTSKKAHNPS